MKIRHSILLASALLLSWSLKAQEQLPANEVFEFLSFPRGVAQTGMAGAGKTLLSESTALAAFDNPAVLPFALNHVDATVLYGRWAPAQTNTLSNNLGGGVSVRLGKGFAVIFAIGATALVLMFATPEETLKDYRRALTWKHRIEAKFSHSDSKDDKTSANMEEKWQENTAHIAIANSNVVGLGVGNSIERDFLPHAESDFIYSIIVEETGVFGGLFVLLLYVMLLVRVWRIAQKCDKYFPAYLVIGLGLMMVVQALVNMAVSVGLFPVTGQTLPLISHGGTSIIITSFNMGMILSVSRYAQSVTEKAKALEMASANETEEFASSEGMQ